MIYLANKYPKLAALYVYIRREDVRYIIVTHDSDVC